MERIEEWEGDGEKWVQDSSVNHKGKTPQRTTTGVWRASFFIIAFEFTEKLCVFGLGSNMIIYLTKVLHQEVKVAAKNVNYWTGVSTMTPLLGGFIADAYLGRFCMVSVSSIIYLAGLSLLSMSQLIPSLKPCDPSNCHKSLKKHEAVFFVAVFLISIASGGYKPGIQSFGADQFDEGHAQEKKKKMSFFNWWNFGLCSGMLLGVTVIVYVEDNVSWGVAYGILTIVMVISFMIFLLGRPFYRYQIPKGSPLTPMVQVLVAAMAKRHLPHPSDIKHLHEVAESRSRLLHHTNRFRFLDKAAIVEHWDANDAFKEDKLNRWRLATLTQVEEMKLILSIIPIWLTSLPFNISFAQTSLFVKQGSIMNQKMSSSFDVPAASLFGLLAISMLITVTFYDKILEPFVRRYKRNERGISMLRRIGIGMVISIVAMLTAGHVERKRLKAALLEQNNIVSMSIFWLAPQFMITGIADGFTLVGLQEYFYDQVPDNMRSIGMALYFCAVGVANLLNSILITVVDDITERGGNSWFAKDLNKSRLDYFYWLIAAINAANIFVYVYVASRYSYKGVPVQEIVGISHAPERKYNNDNAKV